MGRTATPAAFKNLAGTSRPDRTAGVGASSPGEVLALMPAAPAWLLDAWAVHEWHRLGPVLLHAGLLTVGNINTFAQMCAVHGALATCYENGGKAVASDVAQYIKLVGEFGLTPATAAKVRGPDPAASRSNAFATNGRR